ncbi:MAG TPA: apolipoprotein N-acyltransferase [Alphaproteobacteria bacterium]|nr:apolipoprotein N-acyltransferase [Alphaproteobacteria bacterium]
MFKDNLSTWLQSRGTFARAGLCLIGGMLGVFALAPFSWPVFFFPGFILTAFYLRHSWDWKQSFLCAFAYALGFHVAGLYWISASLFIDIARYVWVLPFSLLALPAWLSLLFALGAIIAHPFRFKPLAHATALACTLFLSEILRGMLLTGFPWNLFGSIWIEALPLAQSVSLFGVLGLTFFTLLAGTLASLLLDKPSRAAVISVVLSWALLSGLALWGEMRLTANPTQLNKSALVRIVQPGIAQVERKTYADRLAAMQKLIQLSLKKTVAQPTHLLWPETAVPDFVAEDAEMRRALMRLVPKGGALITGTPDKIVKGDEAEYHNALVVLNDGGHIIGIYSKHHLVPFGEFIPLRGILKAVPLATDVIGSRGDFTPGPGPRTLRAPGFPPFSPLICYEAIFSDGVVDPSDPPQLLIQVTNDAWFGTSTGPYQHLAQARLRAIEEGLPLLRAANSGVSAVVDPLGRTVSSLALNQTGVLDSALPLPLSHTTLFSRYGNWPVFVLAAFLFLIIALFTKLPRKKIF